MKKKYETPLIKHIGGTFDQATGFTRSDWCIGGASNRKDGCSNGNSHTVPGSCITGKNNPSGSNCSGGQGNTKYP